MKREKREKNRLGEATGIGDRFEPHIVRAVRRVIRMDSLLRLISLEQLTSSPFSWNLMCKAVQ